MENFRVQTCGNDWILRHPDNMIPVIKCKNREDLIAQLPAWFKRRKEIIQIDVLNNQGMLEKQIQIDPAAGNTPV